MELQAEHTGFAGWLRFLGTAIRMSFRRNLQYRGQHMINNVASAIFGFIYIAIWQAVTRGGTGQPGYGAETLTRYIIVCQCMLWNTTFDRAGLELARKVRDGTIGSDLIRPVGFMALQMSQFYGGKLYGFLFRSLAVAGVFALTVGMPLPAGQLLVVVAALALAMHIGTLMTYFVGLAGFWTVETSWLYLIAQTATLMLGGASVPLDFLPAGMQVFARLTPFPCMAYYPSALYLGLTGPATLLTMAGWAAGLTLLAGYLTTRARRRAEVVGG